MPDLQVGEEQIKGKLKCLLYISSIIFFVCIKVDTIYNFQSLYNTSIKVAPYLQKCVFFRYEEDLIDIWLILLKNYPDAIVLGMVHLVLHPHGIILAHLN